MRAVATVVESHHFHGAQECVHFTALGLAHLRWICRSDARELCALVENHIKVNLLNRVTVAQINPVFGSDLIQNNRIQATH